MKYLSVLMFVLFVFVPYMSCLLPFVICLYVVLFLLWAAWLLTQHVNKQELNWIEFYYY
jgi:hypothetical protein